MRYLFLIILIGTCALQVHSQSYSSAFDLGNQRAEIMSTRADTSFNNNYLLSANKLEDGFVQIVIETNDSKSETFKLKPFSYESFKLKSVKALTKLIEKAEGISVAEESLIRLNDEVYFFSAFGRIVASFNIANDKPIVAKLEIRDGIYAMSGCKVKANNDSLIRKYYLNNSIIEISFFGGYIEKIEVTGTINDIKVVFTNKYSIGISSVSNLKRLESLKLYSIGKYNFTAGNNITKSYDEGCNLYLYLGNAIDYDREVEVNANDISPENQKIVLGDGIESVYLYKEESKQRFSV